jgi:hypothetical protein
MKKKILFGAIIAILLMAFNGAIALAGDIRVQLDGAYVDLEPAPIIVDGRTLLPARAIVEMLGGEIDWDNDLRQVHIDHGGTHIVLTIDDPLALVNGVPQMLDVPPQIMDGRTLVPLRFVAESLGVEVDFYDGAVIITTARTIMVTNRNFVLSDGTNLTILYSPVVRRGSDAEVAIVEGGPPEAVWYLNIRYAAGYGTAAGLGEQISDAAGYAAWRWRVGSNTTIGDWPVTISGSGESLRFYISIVAND